MKNKIEFGQHFIKNDIVSEKMSSYINSKETVNLLEIGGGSGSLTKYFVDLKYKQLRIVEIDSSLIPCLEKIAEGRQNIFVDNISILDYELIDDGCKWNITGNIPFNITFKIIEKIIKWRSSISSIVLIIQEEVAQKLYRVGGKGYGPISVLIQYFFAMELLDKLSPKEFYPEPRVFSRIVRLIPKKIDGLIDINEFSKFLSVLFKFPRKKIKNNVIGTVLEKSFNEEVLKKRAQEFSFDILVELFIRCN
jgi:16S rRNA (adenine1518-N6/adenine1519-N6)-dimethyltransferase